MKWSSAQWRCYNSIRCGLMAHKDKTLRFLTLSSVSDMDRSITVCFRILVDRIERLYPMKMVNLGLISKGNMKFYYPDLNPFDKLTFDFISVLTSEGVAGVLHILYFGDYLNEKWLKSNWKDITGGAWNLHVSKVDVNKSVKDLTYYVVSQTKIFQYVTGQGSYVRHHYSKRWVYSGWRKDFNRLRYACSSAGKEKYPNSKFGVFWTEWRRWFFIGRFEGVDVSDYIQTRQTDLYEFSLSEYLS